jgi:hypothetical protein
MEVLVDLLAIRAPVNPFNEAVDFPELLVNSGLEGNELAAIDLDDDATARTRNLGAGFEQANRLLEGQLAFGTSDRDWGGVEDHRQHPLPWRLAGTLVAGLFTSSTLLVSISPSSSPSGQILNPPFALK